MTAPSPHISTSLTIFLHFIFTFLYFGGPSLLVWTILYIEAASVTSPSPHSSTLLTIFLHYFLLLDLLRLTFQHHPTISSMRCLAASKHSAPTMLRLAWTRVAWLVGVMATSRHPTSLASTPPPLLPSHTRARTPSCGCRWLGKFVISMLGVFFTCLVYISYVYFVWFMSVSSHVFYLFIATVVCFQLPLCLIYLYLCLFLLPYACF